MAELPVGLGTWPGTAGFPVSTPPLALSRCCSPGHSCLFTACPTRGRPMLSILAGRCGVRPGGSKVSCPACLRGSSRTRASRVWGGRAPCPILQNSPLEALPALPQGGRLGHSLPPSLSQQPFPGPEATLQFSQLRLIAEQASLLTL